MNFQFLGTAAAEGIPALFCTCDVCVRARAAGGKAIRTRSQAMIDGALLIDFPADTYAHVLNNRLDLTAVGHCIITHDHSDHLYPAEIRMLENGFAHVQDGYHLSFYGSAKVGEDIRPMLANALERQGTASFTEVKAFDVFKAGKYTVTALPAIHDPNSGPLFYDISDGKKRVLYAHDTHYFHDDVWTYFEREKPHYDLVSLDCTNACTPMEYVGHMSFAENIKVKERMCALGCADEKTVFVCNHFSHNGSNAGYDDFVPIAAKEGFLVSYDGMSLNL